ncbi:DNA polymerase-3 subunit gamma/tau [Chitinivorax tropicus]|uniref:DNA polymerase III subunit gamma/tau n=1 Tax=Chitinivorax tropicus TaxID=714531 RepID=A0A840MWR6_9PROT|nr:DNA polymerase III subunit gamma/tau [Chitinivorax tropicus]MBB5019611.1 DNA polymerase-3 subunit gamma/tau [Chitinivorax tropicus]
MTYQVLARKWRSRNFAQVVGQEHVVRAITNALEKQRLHHAYLFTGTRGVGKTSIARILAKSLNCETGITAEPCGQCAACTQIDAGRFVDLLELDAASNTGIDNMREVIDNAQYAPTAGRFKVYIIDEVHMLSKSAFNAMLKTLEEPPAHVKFILATTDPQKVPITVLSRCLQFNLRQIPPQTVAEHLAYVLGQEQIPFEAGALALLGHAAAGSMRDSLSLLDQAIAYGAGKVEEAGVRAMLGAIDQSYLFNVLSALAERDGPAVLAQADAMAKRSIAFDAALQELAALLQRVALVQVVPSTADGLQDADRIRALAGQLSAEDVQLFYQIAIHGRKDLALAPDEYAGFTMTLLRMLAFTPDGRAGSDAPRPPSQRPAPAARETPPAPQGSEPGGPLSHVRTLLAVKGTASAGVPAARQAPPPTAVSPPAARSAPPLQAVKSTPPAVPAKTPPADDVPPWLDEMPPGPASMPAQIETVDHRQGAAGELGRFDGDWMALVSKLPLDGRVKPLALNSLLQHFEGSHFELALDAQYRAAADKVCRDRLAAILSAYFACQVSVSVAIVDNLGDTPWAIRQAAIRSAIEEDPFVKAVQHEFDAIIVDGSIRALAG